MSLETGVARIDTGAQDTWRAIGVSWRNTTMSKAHFTTVVVGLVALLSAVVLATGPVDEALAAAGAADAASVDGPCPLLHPAKGPTQWNS